MTWKIIIILIIFLVQPVIAPNLEPIDIQDPRESACIKAAQACSAVLEGSVDKEAFINSMDNMARYQAAEVEKNTHPIRTLVPIILFLFLYSLVMIYAKAKGWVL